jgi:biotin/methionine sulfoxide reductase
MKKVVEPFGEARDDFQIFRELARRLEIDVSFDEGLEQSDWLRRLYSESRDRNLVDGVELPPFDEFWQEGQADLTPFDQPSVMLAEFVADPDANPLDTPTGKIEIFSKTVAGFGIEDCPGHPCWFEPFEWLGADAAAEHPLHLLSDQPSRRLHSQLDPSPHSVAGKVEGSEQIHINASDAAARGIRHGQIVEVFNGRGRCLAAANVSDDLMPGVARLNTGAWYDPDPVTGLERHGNPNLLTSDRGCSGLSQGSSAQTCLVEIRPFEGELPELAAFRLPELRQRTGEAAD